jgi:hypothetical protein
MGRRREDTTHAVEIEIIVNIATDMPCLRAKFLNHPAPPTVRVGLLRVDAPLFWIDESGLSWRVPAAQKRQKWNGPIHYRLRAFVFRRDKFTCQGCGLRPPDIPATYNGHAALWITEEPRNLLVVDHIIAVKNFGSCHPDNLQAMCERCNGKKAGHDGQIARDRTRALEAAGE